MMATQRDHELWEFGQGTNPLGAVVVMSGSFSPFAASPLEKAARGQSKLNCPLPPPLPLLPSQAYTAEGERKSPFEGKR